MHINKQRIITMVKTEAVNGLDCDISEPTPCNSCLIGKSKRQPFPKLTKDLKTEVLELVHADVMGPLDVKSWGGCRYILTIIDDASRFIKVCFLKAKSDVLGEFKKWKIQAEKQTGELLKRVRTDNGLEFCSKG